MIKIHPSVHYKLQKPSGESLSIADEALWMSRDKFQY